MAFLPLSAVHEQLQVLPISHRDPFQPLSQEQLKPFSKLEHFQ